MAERKEPNPTVLPDAPIVSSSITDPRARAYADQVAQRRQPLKYNVPAGGGPLPAMPALDSVHQPGRTIAAHAQPLPIPQGGILAPKPQAVPTAPQTGFAFPGQRTGTPPAAPMALAPTDTLPAAAQQDPAFRPGMGSMSAMAQPELARKYGIIRNGIPIMPQDLQEPARAGRLRSATVEGLQAVADFNKTRSQVEGDLSAQEAQAERDVAAGPAGAAARLAGTPGVTEDRPPRDPLERVDSLDLERYREMSMEDLLNNDKQREIIEERLEPMSLAQLIMDERATQIVPIHPGVLEPEFQSMTMEDELTIKRLIVKEAKALEVTDKYLLDKYSMMSLVVGLKAINKVQLGTHLKDNHFDEDAFWLKFNRIMRLPLHLIASLAINFFWFEVRVRKLHVAERIKNG